MLKFILSDKYRFLKIVILIAFLVLLQYYSYYMGPRVRISPSQCLLSSKEYDGKEVIMNSICVAKIEKDGYLLVTKDERMRLKGNMSQAKIGDLVSVRTIFRDTEGGIFILKDHHIRRHDNLKYIISFVSFLVVLITFLRHFRFSVKRFIFEERRCQT